ncbi:hypothetical protein ALI22I_27435 [Saccharothrix sp. ALI-22-I]|nr:hypothetical protein ALI22I_27435 [Saccharothrix sp. ALI-22-I]
MRTRAKVLSALATSVVATAAFVLAFVAAPQASAATLTEVTGPAFHSGTDFARLADQYGQVLKTPQEWGDIARSAYPGYSGARPRVQLWHDTADDMLRYPNFGEEIDQWTNVLSTTPTATDSPQSGWTRTRY